MLAVMALHARQYFNLDRLTLFMPFYACQAARQEQNARFGRFYLRREGSGASFMGGSM
jgi:hypothetical protein